MSYVSALIVIKASLLYRCNIRADDIDDNKRTESHSTQGMLKLRLFIGLYGIASWRVDFVLAAGAKAASKVWMSGS